MARIFTRSDWGARAGRGSSGRWKRSEMVIHTEAGATVNTVADDPDTIPDEGWGVDDFMARVRQIEDFHTRPKSRGGRGWSAIAYSFLVDPVHGWVAEGRGWGRDGSHTQQGRNQTAYAICMLGHGDRQSVTEAGWAGAELVIRDGLQRDALTSGYAVTGHRNYARKSCPGDLVYPHIGRLRGLTTATKEWDEMATKTEIKDALREVFEENTYVMAIEGKQYLCDERLRLASYIPDHVTLTKLAGMYGVRDSIPVGEFRGRFEVDV